MQSANCKVGGRNGNRRGQRVARLALRWRSSNARQVAVSRDERPSATGIAIQIPSNLLDMLAFLAIGRQGLLLVLYVLLNTGFFAALRTFLCSRCMNFACPLNRVKGSVRALFFERNPSAEKGWDGERRE